MALSSLLLLPLAGVAAAQVDIGHLFPDCASGLLADNDVCNSNLSPGERARALVAALRTEEKFGLINNESPGVERLGLPSYEWWQEALHGVADSPGVTFNETGDFSYATSFPQPILMGAAFDDAMIEAVATVVSTEARAFNNFNRSGLDYWTPNINPYRDPRWGRGQETPGEDPFHLSSYVGALIRGLQGGEDPEVLKVVATCKHFAGYDLEDWHGVERYEFSAQITPQDLAEYYTPPFEACARANVGSFMCTYNALNDVPTCASEYLLGDVLRKHWGWDRDYQYVTSDCDSIQNIYLPHGYTDTREGAAAAALKAGTDLDCGFYYLTHLPAAYEQGLITDEDLDRPLVRLYAALVKLGYFDPEDGGSGKNSEYRALDFSDVSTSHAQELARVAAEKGIVLLKNKEDALPLNVPDDGEELSLAFVGGWATAEEDMQGNYFGVAPYLISPLKAAQQMSGITAIDGGDPGDPTTTGYPEVIDAAKAADVILFFDGPTNSGESEDNDRNGIRFSGERVDIITHLASFGKPLILVTMGGQQDTSPFQNHPNISAILWAGYPGQSGGEAIMNVLTGQVAPAGRLPVTQYPEKYAKDVAMTDMGLRPDEKTGNPGRTYMWYPEEKATVPFGFGLHYTEFEAEVASGGENQWNTQDLVDGCDDDVEEKQRCSFRTVEVKVSNAGDNGVTSDYVTLGFLAGEHGPEPYPIKRLVAYTRLASIGSGESKTAELPLTLESLARRNKEGDLVLYPGDYSLVVDVAPVKASWNFTLTGDEVVLSEWPRDTGR